MFKLEIQPADEVITVRPGQTILDAALRAGIALPNDCRAGNCGGCKCRLLDGEIEMSPYSEFALPDYDRDSGYILACRSVPWSNGKIALIDSSERAVHTTRQLVCAIESTESATHDISIIRLNILEGGPFRFSAGQYAKLKCGTLPERQYSMASLPGDPFLEFHVKQVPGGVVSAHICNEMQPGSKIQLSGPAGGCYLRDGHNGPILAIAGGSGLAPIKSIIETALKKNPNRKIDLYFGVRAMRDIYLEEHFRSLEKQHKNLKFYAVLSEASELGPYRTGLVTDAVRTGLLECSDPKDGLKAYVCGPPPMVRAACTMLVGSGVAPENIHSDAFMTEADQAAVGRDV